MEIDGHPTQDLVEELERRGGLRAEGSSSGPRIDSLRFLNERTGVEMEALTAVSVAALTIYDMVKGVERGVEVTDVRLLRKSGGRSGEWRRES